MDRYERDLIAAGYLRFDLPTVHLEPKEYRITHWPLTEQKSRDRYRMIGTIEYRPE
jgi:hypothetical protein